ncbi:MAG: SET domain-containing protein [Candidatus Uhrbacteria bacterium]|nr:SET domain-containing protein [Candidatus Uhrbacteria bacterium]
MHTDLETDEFSFLLKPSEHGIGVFAAHDIKQGVYLMLFGDKRFVHHKTRFLKKVDVPAVFHDYCIDRGEDLICPPDFSTMNVGWYLNHATERANATHKDLRWYAARDITCGEEILIDYKTLQEPKEAVQDYYAL